MKTLPGIIMFKCEGGGPLGTDPMGTENGVSVTQRLIDPHLRQSHQDNCNGICTVVR